VDGKGTLCLQKASNWQKVFASELERNVAGKNWKENVPGPIDEAKAINLETENLSI
jgi:hypothetical protein